MANNEEEDNFIAPTQPVMSLLMKGVVAYVEVRSGHDNRSRGVKTHLKNLGATIEDKLTSKVTHVIFNEGLPSTYKKAKKLKCHLVSVLWIEACKENMDIVSEAGYPPIGQEIYENPQSLKNFKKLKSMQPDFDEEETNLRLLRACKRMKRRVQAPVSTSHRTLMETDEESESSKTSRQKSRGQSTTKQRKRTSNSKASKKKTALTEITPDVVNKFVAGNGEEEQDVSATTSDAEVLIVPETLSSSPVCASISSSVIYCGSLVETRSSNQGVRKSSKISRKNISRSEFIEGLGSIVSSLCKENGVNTYKTSPWRMNVEELKKNKTTEKKPPLKVKTLDSNRRHTESSANISLFPRRSPRTAKDHVNSNKKETQNSMKPLPCSTASAVLRQKCKKLISPPLSPGDDFVLLSQEPGDMPSIDELAKQKRGSINVAGERITLSQIVRSYNSVVQEQSESSSQGTESSLSYLTCQAENESSESACTSHANLLEHEEENMRKDDSIVSSGEIVADTELGSHNENKSDAGSSFSSFSTSVLINGKVSNCQKPMACASSTLSCLKRPDSIEVSFQVSDQDQSCSEDFKREPSPIFVIKKAKYRRPVKKPQENSLQKSSSADTESSNRMTQRNGKEIPSSVPSKQRRGSLNPINYINNLMLPKFLSGTKTPNVSDLEDILVQETPDVCSPKTATDTVLIPPTPANGQQDEETVNTASPNSSFTNSVLSWVKKSCKIPLFSPRSKTPLATAAESTPKTQGNSACENPQIEISHHDSSKEIQLISDERPACPASGSLNICKDKAQSQNTDSLNNKSTRKRKVDVPVHMRNRDLQKKKTFYQNEEEKISTSCKVKNDDHTAIKDSKSRSKITATVVGCGNDDDQVLGKADKNLVSILTKSPVILLQRSDEVHSPSGNNSSHSNSRNNEEKVCSGKKFAKPNAEQKNALSPIKKVAKDSSGNTLRKRTSCRTSGKRRTQSLERSDGKKQKLSDPDTQCLFDTRSSHLSRVDYKRGLESQSFDDSKPFGRRCSEEAKKRMAKSLTRTCNKEVPKVIVCTFLTASEQNGIEVAGKLLRGWKLAEKVTARTTHVINSGPKRTLNMLKGMVRGCWLVDQKWMLDSSKAGSWLDEEKYELVEFSPAVKQCRMRRQVAGADFKYTLFSRVGTIFVSPKTESPPAKEIRELLELCGADVKNSSADVKIVIGENLSHMSNSKCVQPKWVLDCITKNKILPVSNAEYKIK